MDRRSAAALVVASALAFLGAGCGEERVVLAPTSVRAAPETGAAPVRALAMGDVVRAKRRAGDPAGVLRVDDGFVDEPFTARPPLATEQRWVADHGAFLWRLPARTNAVRSLAVGERLDVLARAPFDEVAVVVVDGKPAAFVSRDVLATSAPTRASAWARVEQRLRAQDVDATLRALEALLVTAPDDGPGKEMLAVLLAGRDWPRSRKLAATISAPLPYVDGGLTRATMPGPAWVLASTLRMRDAPDETGHRLRDLPIGTAVVVEDITGDGWARIHVRDDRASAHRAVRRDDGTFALEGDAVEVPTDVDAGLASGFALSRYLTPTAPTLDVLEAQRKDAERRGMLDEAALWAQRANELMPSPERRAALIDAALAASRWTLAATALLPPRVERPSPVADLDVAFAFGCRGDPRTARFADVKGEDGVVVPDLASDALDACTSWNEPPACGLCWFDDGEGPVDAEARAANEAAKKAEQARVDAAQAAFARRHADVRARFPSGPYLRVRSRPSSWPEGTTPYLATVRGDGSVVAPNPDVLVRVAAIPLPASPSRVEGTVDVWLPVDDAWSLRFDVLFATDDAHAQELAKALDARDGDSGAVPDVVAASVARASDACDCGC